VPALSIAPTLLVALPAVLFAVAAVVAPRRSTVAEAWGLARGATVAVVATALAVAGVRIAGGERSNAVARLDNTTVAMLLLVALVAWVVVRYSSTYLAGDPHERRYIARMLATVAAVSVVVMANHLVLLVVAWAATSVALHGLLTFFGDRPVAVAVAHKKFLLARAADACMIGAVVAFVTAFGTLRIDSIVAEAVAAPTLPMAARIGIMLVAVAVVLKCAQLPFHGWLIQVMEAPTPVSALLHAGVVNLGGFVLLRMAPVVDRSVEARTLLVLVGAGTAVLAALVMTTRVSVKVSLAWSTCAQMGFMLVQCGLGLWEMALLHLLAHSMYKAYAFLGAGGVVRQTQRAQLSARQPVPTVAQVMVGVLVAAVATAVVGVVWQLLPFTKGVPASVWVMMGVVALALVPLATPRGRGSVVRLVGRAVAVPLAYVALHDLAALVVPAGAAAPIALVVFTGLAFAALFVAQTWFLVAPNGRLACRVRPWLYAGFFLDDVFTRMAFAVSRPPSTVGRPRQLPQQPTVVVLAHPAAADTSVQTAVAAH
jgi:NAD(P)H-quinone oxidoreductase subunit 5